MTFFLEPKPSLLDWVTALGTLGSAVVALYVVLSSWLHRARFSVSIDPAFSLAVETTMEGMLQPEAAEHFTAAKIRFLVKHIGGGGADNVEVLVSKVWKFDESDVRKEFPYFAATNLSWSRNSKERVTREHFSSEIIRFCDFGVYVLNTDFVGDNWHLYISVADKPGDPITSKFSNLLSPGKYEFEVLLSGHNTQPLKTNWLVEFDGNWSTDEEEMFSKHFKIKAI